MTDSILNVEISRFKSYHATEPETTNLIEWLQDATHKQKVFALRATKDKVQMDKIKAGLPAVTISGKFRQRKKEELEAHSGLICIDIDRKDNLHLGNYDDIKRILAKAPFVAYCGLSVSGTGYYVIIPIEYTDRHEQHFAAIQRLFKALNINIDSSCKDVSRLRGYSWDDTPYINHAATKFTHVAEEKEQSKPFEKAAAGDKKATGDTDSETKTKERVEKCIAEIKSRGIDITDAYKKWLQVGFSLASQFGEAGRQYFHDVSRNHTEYDYAAANKKYTQLLESNKSNYKIGSFFHLCKAHGIVG